MEYWLQYAIALGVGFPALMIGLGMIRTALRRSDSPFYGVVKHTQNIFLPMVALYLASTFVVNLGSEQHHWSRVLLTIAGLSGIYVALTFIAEVIFGAAPEGTLRSRTPKLLRDIVIVISVGAGAASLLAVVWDQDVAALFTALGVGSIVLGLALQETLGNVMSGIALLLERPFSEGDFVEIDSVEGTVKEINWRATRLIDRRGDQIILPHAITSTARIINNTSIDATDAVLIELGFGYEHPPNEVKAMLLHVLKQTEGVLSDPEPNISTIGYGDSAVNYRVYFRIDHPLNKFKVRDRFMTRVWYAAQRRSINIPFPIRTVHNYDGASLVDTERTGRALKDVGSVFFGNQPFLDNELDQWAQGAKVQYFSSGEHVITQGNSGSNLYVVIAGCAKITALHNYEEHTLYTLSRGEFFGETTIFSRLSSPYTVIADGDLETLALTAETVNRIIENKPSIALQIGKIIETRRKDIRSLSSDTLSRVA